MKDIKFGLRQLMKYPGFTLVAVLTLALGIGANTTIFAFVDAFLLKPLPFPDSARLISIGKSDRPGGEIKGSVSYPDYLDIQSQNSVFDEVAVYDWEPFNFATQEEPLYVAGARVSGNFFQTLKVQPILGRTFAAQDDRPDAAKVVILGETLWRNQFDADPGILGEIIHLDSEPRQVIGVVPQESALPMDSRVWIPMALDPSQANRGSHWLLALGRLRDGKRLGQAQAELATLSQRLQETYPGTNRDKLYSGLRLKDRILGPQGKSFFYFLLGAVGCLLLIVCANVANLLLSRSLSRSRELAIRSAIGARRWHLIRQLLAESAWLALTAGLLGMSLSIIGVRALAAAIPAEAMGWFSLAIDHRVLLFNAGVAVGSILLFGLMPALHATRLQLQGRLKESVGASTGVTSQRLQRHLVIAELAFALMLLAGAGMMVRSFVHYSHVDPGFATKHRLTASIPLPKEKYQTPEQRIAFYEALMPRLQAMSGVQAVGVVSHFPFSGGTSVQSYSTEGQDAETFRRNPQALFKVASPDYFRAMAIDLLRGRGFQASDALDAPGVVIVNQPFANALWPGEDPVGKRLKFGPPGGGAPWLEVIGVVEGVRHDYIHQPAPPHLYVPYTQDPSQRLCLALHVTSEPAQWAAVVRRVIQEVDPYQAIYRVMPLSEVMAGVLLQLRITSALFWTFGILALGIAAVGTYGVMAFAVSQRVREIGIRMSLGATRMEILKMVIRQGMKDCWIGTAIGLVLAFGITRAMGALLLDSAFSDWLSPLAAVVVLCLAALLACAIPAQRAASIDPMNALRCE